MILTLTEDEFVRPSLVGVFPSDRKKYVATLVEVPVRFEVNLKGDEVFLGICGLGYSFFVKADSFIEHLSDENKKTFLKEAL